MLVLILDFCLNFYHSHNFETGDWQSAVRRLQASMERHVSGYVNLIIPPLNECLFWVVGRFLLLISLV